MANKNKTIVVDASELDMLAKYGVKEIQAGSKRIILKNKKRFPAYVKFKYPDGTTGSVMRTSKPGYEKQTHGMYYRDAGMWGCDAKWIDGKLFCSHYMEHLNGTELVEATKEEYITDNEGYL